MSRKFYIGIFVAFIVVILFYFTFSSSSLTGLRSNDLNSDISAEIVQTQFSYKDILANEEFKIGMQKAVQESDIKLAESLQVKAIEIAEAANLADAEIEILAGARGLQYMQFLAKRQLFAEAFERRYLSLKGIQDIKLIYPEAKDMFSQSDKLIEQRDQQIKAIAVELANNNNDSFEKYYELAKKQWKQANSK